MLYKNTTGQKIAVYAYTASTGAAKTGDAAQITGYISKDWAAAAQITDTNPTELDATNMKGWYVFDLAQAETNANVIVVSAVSSTSGVLVDQYQVFTTASVDQTGDAYARLGAPAGASVSADIAVIYTDTQRVDALIEHVEPEPDGPPPHDRFTSEALETSPFLDSTEIRDAVWGANLTSYQSDGSTGEALKNIEDTVDSATFGNSALATLIGDVPTNAELATALGTADDAVLAAIAALDCTVAISSTTAASVSSGAIGIRTHHTLSQAITSTYAGNLATATKLWLAIKLERDDADSAAVAFIEKTAGLTVLAQAAYTTVAHGTLVVGGLAGAWTVTIGMDEVATGLLTSYAESMLRAECKALVGGATVALWDGVCDISRGIVQAVI